MVNKISVDGLIIASPTYTHTIKKKRFYRGVVLSTRLSGAVDRLQFVCEEKHLPRLSTGSMVNIGGCIRTRNVESEDGIHLDVFIYVRDVRELVNLSDTNEVEIDGYVCYASSVREVGARKISCVKVANNGAYNKTNYLPCVLWGHDAERYFEIGDEIHLRGRLQSRDYLDADKNPHTTYEISVYELC